MSLVQENNGSNAIALYEINAAPMLGIHCHTL